MKRCRKSKISLLPLSSEHQEHSSRGLASSPAQRLLGGRTKTAVPTIKKLLEPAGGYVELEKRRMVDKRALVAEHYNNKRNMKPLEIGDVVRMQPIETNKKDWKEATVSKRVKSRSYEVTTAEGKTYRRNRQFLQATVRSRWEHQMHQLPTTTDQGQKSSGDITSASSSRQSPEPARTTRPTSTSKNSTTERAYAAPSMTSVLAETNTRQTRSGRVIRKPKRLDL